MARSTTRSSQQGRQASTSDIEWTRSTVRSKSKDNISNTDHISDTTATLILVLMIMDMCNIIHICNSPDRCPVIVRSLSDISVTHRATKQYSDDTLRGGRKKQRPSPGSAASQDKVDNERPQNDKRNSCEVWVGEQTPPAGNSTSTKPVLHNQHRQPVGNGVSIDGWNRLMAICTCHLPFSNTQQTPTLHTWWNFPLPTF